MNNYKKILAISIVSLFLFSIIISTAFAATPTDRLQKTGTAAGFRNITTSSMPQTVGQIIKGFISILGFIFMAYIVYGGYLWMTASGDEEKIKKSKTILRGSITGLIVALSAYIITTTVIARFSGAGGYGDVGIESTNNKLI